MKKKLLTLLSLFVIFAETDAAEITVSDISIQKGGTALMEVYLTNTDKELVAFQFQMELPQGIKPAVDENNQYILQKGSRISSLAVTIGLSNIGTNKYQFAGYQGSGLPVPFPGTEGQMVTIMLTTDDTVQEGDELNATLTDIRVTDTSARTNYLNDATFIINVTAPPAKTVLDENSTTVPEASTGDVEILVKRTIKAGEWNTICLPFAMTETQTKTVFGNDMQIIEFVNYELEEDTEGNITSITVNFEDYDLEGFGFEANHPYLIKVSNPIEEFECTSTIEPDEGNAVVEYDNGRTGSRKVVYGTLYGTLHAGDYIPNNNLFLNSNLFYYSKGKTKIKAFRGYFDFIDVLSSVEGAGIKMRVTLNGEVTSIIGIGEEIPTGAVYNLQGIFIGNDTSDLQKGIYIVNGKKIVIK